LSHYQQNHIKHGMTDRRYAAQRNIFRHLAKYA